MLESMFSVMLLFPAGECLSSSTGMMALPRLDSRLYSGGRDVAGFQTACFDRATEYIKGRCTEHELSSE